MRMRERPLGGRDEQISSGPGSSCGIRELEGRAELPPGGRLVQANALRRRLGGARQRETDMRNKEDRRSRARSRRRISSSPSPAVDRGQQTARRSRIYRRDISWPITLDLRQVPRAGCRSGRCVLRAARNVALIGWLARGVHHVDPVGRDAVGVRQRRIGSRMRASVRRVYRLNSGAMKTGAISAPTTRSRRHGGAQRRPGAREAVEHLVQRRSRRCRPGRATPRGRPPGPASSRRSLGGEAVGVLAHEARVHRERKRQEGDGQRKRHVVEERADRPTAAPPLGPVADAPRPAASGAAASRMAAASSTPQT